MLLNRVERLLFAAGASSPVALACRVSAYLQRPCTDVGDQTILTQTVTGHLLHLDARDISLLRASSCAATGSRP